MTPRVPRRLDGHGAPVPTSCGASPSELFGDDDLEPRRTRHRLRPGVVEPPARVVHPHRADGRAAAARGDAPDGGGARSDHIPVGGRLGTCQSASLSRPSFPRHHPADRGAVRPSRVGQDPRTEFSDELYRRVARRAASPAGRACAGRRAGHVWLWTRDEGGALVVGRLVRRSVRSGWVEPRSSTTDTFYVAAFQSVISDERHHARRAGGRTWRTAWQRTSCRGSRPSARTTRSPPLWALAHPGARSPVARPDRRGARRFPAASRSGLDRLIRFSQIVPLVDRRWRTNALGAWHAGRYAALEDIADGDIIAVALREAVRAGWQGTATELLHHLAMNGGLQDEGRAGGRPGCCPSGWSAPGRLCPRSDGGSRSPASRAPASA